MPLMKEQIGFNLPNLEVNIYDRDNEIAEVLRARGEIRSTRNWARTKSNSKSVEVNYH